MSRSSKHDYDAKLLLKACAALEHRNITWSGRTSSIYILRTFPAPFETHLLFSATGGAVYNTSKRREKPELPSKQNGGATNMEYLGLCRVSQVRRGLSPADEYVGYIVDIG